MSGSGGGSSSGAVDYPDYMKNIHSAWLSNLSSLISSSISGASPFATATAYNPDTAITAELAAACNFETQIETLDSVTDFASSITNAITYFDTLDDSPTWVDPSPAAEDEISADVTAFQAIQDDILENETLPRFRAGMRDINAVHSGAFVLGEAYIEAANVRDIAKYQGDLRVKAFLLKDELMAKSAMMENDFNLKLELDRRQNIVKFSDTLLRHILTKAELQKAVVHYLIEARRIQIIAKKEESEANLLLNEQDAKWDLEAYQYGANMLGAISGGVVHNSQAKTSKVASALGGALSGAAVGASIGGPYGAIAGGVIGLASSFF